MVVVRIQIAVEHYFPKMDDGTRTKAKALAMQWQPGSHLKAVRLKPSGPCGSHRTGHS